MIVAGNTELRAFIWCMDHLNKLYTFRVMHNGNEVRKEERKREEQIQILHSIFSTMRRTNGTLGLYFT